MNMTFTKEVQEIAQNLMLWSEDHGSELNHFEALQIAVQIQKNELFAVAHAIRTGFAAPSALEAIAMELGAAKEGSTIKDAIYSLVQQ